MIRILQIIPTLDRSGAEKQMVLLATGLPKDEFDVRVCTLTRSGPLAEDLDKAGIPVVNIGKRWKFDPLAYSRLKSYIREFQPDLVHTWMFAANAYGRQAAIECGVPKIVAGERCVDPWKKWYHFRIDKALAKKTGLILTNSSGVQDFYVEKGFDSNQFRIIPNGVFPFQKQPGDKEKLLTELGIAFDKDKEPDPHLIGMVARLWPQKRIKDAIWAANTLKVVGHSFHLLILGDGPERERLLRYRDSLGIADRVHFPGHRPDVGRFLSHFDILWCTSEYEGQSNSVLEAMSAGIPVVASDIPGNRDLVIPEQTGVLVPEFGSDFRRRRSMFVEQTLRILNAPELKSAMGVASMDRIRTEFSVEQMVRRHVETYRELLGRNQ